MKNSLLNGLLTKVTLTIFFSTLSTQIALGNNLNNSITTQYIASSLSCNLNGDRNRGHGNDLYVDFTTNIDNVGIARIFGDFDLDNPGKSLDSQMNIIASDRKIEWVSLNDGQKQQIKDEWNKYLCSLSVYPD